MRRCCAVSGCAAARNAVDACLRFLQKIRYPLAVRSSSLLEDSQYQPFTGVYETFMLANQRAEIAGAPGTADGGDQAGIRFHLQPARQEPTCAPRPIAWKKRRWR